MLNYKDFMDALKQAIYETTGWESDYMGSLKDESATSDTTLEIHYMRTDSDSCTVSIKVPPLFARYQLGEKITVIAELVVEKIREDDKVCLAEAVVQCKNYEFAKKRLFVVAESIHNEEALYQCIHQTVGDIAICPNLKLLDRNGKMIGLKVAPEMLRLWKKSAEEVIKDALENAPKLYPPRFYDFWKALGMETYKGEDFMQEDQASVLQSGFGDKCISTTIMQHGAAAIFYPGVAKRICQCMGVKKLYLLFTSVHEVMVVPVKMELPEEILKARLKSGSEPLASPKEKLTEEIYCYEEENNCIHLFGGEGNRYQCE